MIVGHKRQWDFLKTAYEKGSLSHAYLLAGEEQIGKKSLAFKFVKFVHCQERDSGKGKPCGSCFSCRMIEKNTHPDFLLVEHQEGADIKVEQVEKLLRHLSLKPSFSQYKTVIIDQAHLLNRYAQNSLLKSLEEPAGTTLIFLVTSRPYLLLDTILSRVQHLRFLPLSRKEMELFLQKEGAGEKEKKRIMELAQGRPGKALELIKNSALIEEEEKRREELKQILDSDLGSRFEKAKSLSKGEVEPLLLSWMYFFRNNLLKALKSQAEVEPAVKILDELQRAFYLLKTSNVNKKILLQNLMIKLN